MEEEIRVLVGFDVDDQVLTDLQAGAPGLPPGSAQPWTSRLERYSVAWVGAFAADRLVGFVHACWDGGRHAFLLDTAVHPDFRRRGVGRRIVEELTAEVTAAGCEWLHVDYEPHLEPFYRDACGFGVTGAGLRHLTG